MIKDVRSYDSAEEAVARISEIYQESTSLIQREFEALLAGNEVDIERLRDAVYPYVAFEIGDQNLYEGESHLSYGVIGDAGLYGMTVTRPDIFYNYFLEQIYQLIENHQTKVLVGRSDWLIPFSYVVEYGHKHLTPQQVRQIRHTFCWPDLRRIHDDIANSTYQVEAGEVMPLALFEGERIDYSLHRLHHYTGTKPVHFQRFILLTNYQRYMDEFVSYAYDKLQQDPEYLSLIGPGDLCVTKEDTAESLKQKLKGGFLPQMPAYHLTRADGNGITFINIGVGPSNAKTITDHLSVLRPHCWMMIGHCAGLRSSQMLGDYVLAHAYVRGDHVLDEELPTWIPIPPIAEVQVALQDAIAEVTQQTWPELKYRIRTGTVATTDDRNWELRARELYPSLRQSRTIAVDMESATIAANGFRFRVPYGTLLCVSDKPVHGELKLRGMANAFYQERVQQHLIIGLRAVEILRKRGIEGLHSRKLRGFQEVPFR
jgi:AMP nucleosidase